MKYQWYRKVNQMYSQLDADRLLARLKVLELQHHSLFSTLYDTYSKPSLVLSISLLSTIVSLSNQIDMAALDIVEMQRELLSEQQEKENARRTVEE